MYRRLKVPGGGIKQRRKDRDSVKSKKSIKRKEKNFFREESKEGRGTKFQKGEIGKTNSFDPPLRKGAA